jgi:hypothetical protein
MFVEEACLRILHRSPHFLTLYETEPEITFVAHTASELSECHTSLDSKSIARRARDGMRSISFVSWFRILAPQITPVARFIEVLSSEESRPFGSGILCCGYVSSKSNSMLRDWTRV